MFPGTCYSEKRGPVLQSYLGGDQKWISSAPRESSPRPRFTRPPLSFFEGEGVGSRDSFEQLVYSLSGRGNPHPGLRLPGQEIIMASKKYLSDFTPTCGRTSPEQAGLSACRADAYPNAGTAVRIEKIITHHK